MNLSPLNSFISHTCRVGDISGATHYITGNEYYLEWNPDLNNKFQIVYFPQDPGILKCFCFVRLVIRIFPVIHKVGNVDIFVQFPVEINFKQFRAQ